MRAVQFAAVENNEEICHSQAASASEHTIIGLLNATPQRYIISAALEKKQIDGNHYAAVIMRFLMGVKLDYNCRLALLATESSFTSYAAANSAHKVELCAYSVYFIMYSAAASKSHVHNLPLHGRIPNNDDNYAV